MDDLIVRAQSEKVKAKAIIPHDSTYKFYWDIIIIALAVVNAILVPFEIAFNPDFAQSAEYEAIDMII